MAIFAATCRSSAAIPDGLILNFPTGFPSSSAFWRSGGYESILVEATDTLDWQTTARRFW